MNSFFLPLPVVVILLVLAFIGVVSVANGRKVGALRAQSLYPESGKESDEDVLRLVQTGEKIMAIKCYRVVHHTGLKEAKDAVEQLAREQK